MAKDTKNETTDSGELNQKYEDEVVAAQWAQAKALGLTDGIHAESLNPEKPKE